MNNYYSGFVCSLALLLTACGGSSSSEAESVAEPIVGTFSLSVSDAPMSGVFHVGMVLDELVMTDEDGVVHRHDLQGMSFNLLDYQGLDSHLVVDNIDLPIGQYHDVYVSVLQGDGNQGCFVENGQGRHGLFIENGQLPVANFEITTNQHLSLTLEIDLYRGLSNNQGQFRFNHGTSWSIDNRQMGHLLGEVDPQWIADCETAYANSVSTSGQFGHLAYLYPAEVTDISQMADMSVSPPSGLVAPTAVSPMRQDGDGNWYFAMGYLPEGKYRVGYTCLGHLDDPATDDISSNVFEMFKDSGEVVIEPGSQGGQQTIHQCGKGNGGHHGRGRRGG